MDENMENKTPTPDSQPQQQPQPAEPSQEPAPAGELSKDDKMWGMFCHLAGLAMFTSIPFAWVLGPLIIWLIKKDEIAFVDDQGKEALNFQISVSIYMLCCLPLICLAGIGAFLIAGIAIADMVFIVIASIAANKGEAYRYPCCIRLIK